MPLLLVKCPLRSRLELAIAKTTVELSASSFTLVGFKLVTELKCTQAPLALDGHTADVVSQNVECVKTSVATITGNTKIHCSTLKKVLSKRTDFTAAFCNKSPTPSPSTTMSWTYPERDSRMFELRAIFESIKDVPRFEREQSAQQVRNRGIQNIGNTCYLSAGVFLCWPAITF